MSILKLSSCNKARLDICQVGSYLIISKVTPKKFGTYTVLRVYFHFLTFKMWMTIIHENDNGARDCQNAPFLGTEVIKKRQNKMNFG